MSKHLALTFSLSTHAGKVSGKKTKIIENSSEKLMFHQCFLNIHISVNKSSIDSPYFDLECLTLYSFISYSFWSVNGLMITKRSLGNRSWCLLALRDRSNSSRFPPWSSQTWSSCFFSLPQFCVHDLSVFLAVL